MNSVLTSHQIGEMLQVSRRSINNWVEQGRIRAFRTPGGHRRVRVRDLVDFLHTAGIPLPEELTVLSRRRRVMIVDDDAFQLRSIGRMLKRYQDRLEVLLVDRGIDALVRIGSFRPEVVVLDFLMPDLNGVEVCRRLKANEDTAGIEVLVCSASLTPDLEAAALGAGARACLHKPLGRAQLVAELGIEEPVAESAPPSSVHGEA